MNGIDKLCGNQVFEWLKNLISYKLREMIKLNSSRLDYQKKFETLIEAYNSGSANVDHSYKELIEFAKELKKKAIIRTSLLSLFSVSNLKIKSFSEILSLKMIFIKHYNHLIPINLNNSKIILINLSNFGSHMYS